MPLIWNHQLEAFVETAPPMLYDPALEAHKDTEGYTHDNALGAWRKVWPTELYLVKDGIETQNYAARSIFALDHESTGLARRMPDIARNTDSIAISQIRYQPAWFYGGIVVLGDAAYDLSKYNTLCVDWSGHAGMDYGSYGVGIYPSMPPHNGALTRIKGTSYPCDAGRITRKTDTIDISDVTEGIVGVYVNGPSYGASLSTTNATIYNVWLE